MCAASSKVGVEEDTVAWLCGSVVACMCINLALMVSTRKAEVLLLSVAFFHKADGVDRHREAREQQERELKGGQREGQDSRELVLVEVGYCALEAYRDEGDVDGEGYQVGGGGKVALEVVIEQVRSFLDVVPAIKLEVFLRRCVI